MNSKPPKSVKDLSNKIFGNLCVLNFSYIKEKDRRAYWECLCNCGNIKIIAGNNLTNGGTIYSSLAFSCFCKELVPTDNLEYLEWLYNKKEKVS